MVTITGAVVSDVVDAYSAFISSLSPFAQNFINLFLLVVLIVAYAVFIWKLHTFIGTKNIFNFDLNKYNKAKHPFLVKLTASGFYLLEYILIIPFIIFFWFTVFTFFLILLVEESVTISTILLVSAIAIASIRMSSYIPKYGENLARELGKLLPLTFLAVSVLNPNIFINFLSRTSVRLGEISLFFSGIINYLIFIITLEVILRFFEFMFGVMGFSEVESKEEEYEEESEESGS